MDKSSFNIGGGFRFPFSVASFFFESVGTDKSSFKIGGISLGTEQSSFKIGGIFLVVLIVFVFFGSGNDSFGSRRCLLRNGGHV